MATQLSVLNPDPKRLEGPSLLHHLVTTNGDPDAVAIDYLGPQNTTSHVSYRELDRRSTCLALQLRSIWEQTAKSRGTKFIIPLFIPQSPELYIAEIAVLKAGAAFCPISLDVPEQRLRFILRDVEATILLATGAVRSALPDLDAVTIVSADENFDGSEHLSLVPDIDPSHPAYVMYTSGSTGQPKGVVLSHLAATQALLAHDRHIPSFSRFLQFASPTFDVSVFEIFFPLFRRCTLVCGERRQLLSDLPGFINRMDVDAAELTPSVASSLLKGRSSVVGLKTLLTIGEMLKHDVVGEFGGSADQSAVLHGMYGPTEATIHCTLQPSFSQDMSVGNIGIPLDTVSAFIVKPLESDGDASAPPEIVALGEEGELAVGGQQLADGYLNRPEQTQAAFVQHERYGLLYRTGDRAKMTPFGTIECLGRISSGQVKLRGQRIELGEIEHAASKTPGCQSVVAEVISGTLVVFVISKSAGLDASDVFKTCRKWLPAFMVPGDLMVLESLPYLASGKVDRKALHSVYSQRTATAEHESEDEHISSRLHTIIETLHAALDIPMQPSTQLATAGLDSLSAIRIASQLRKAGFAGLDATLLLEARTPAEVESAMDALDGASDDGRSRNRPDLRLQVAGLEAMQPYVDDIDEVLLPTPVQAAMLSETARNSKAYCNWIEFSISSSCKVHELKQYFSELAKHHPLLRSGFVHLNGMAHTHALVTWKDLLPTQVQEVDQLDHRFAIEDERSLARPLAIQIRPSPSEIQVLMLIHHALYDQWSIDVLKTDLSDLLSGNTLDASPSFVHLSACYHNSTEGARTEDLIDFWGGTLRDFSPTPLPLMNGKRCSPLLQRTSWKALGHDMRQLRTAGQEFRCSVPAMFQAATAYLLGTYVGSSDVTYGTVFSGRHLPIPEIERLFGPCLATLPMRLDCGATRSVRDLLHLVHDLNRSIQKHSLLPIPEIKSAANLTPDTRLFDVLFVWQESSLSASKEDCAIKEVDSADQYDYNLVIEFEPTSDGLLARATYQQSLMTHHQVEMLLQQISALTDAMLRDPGRLVEDLPQSLPDTALSLWNTNPAPCAPGHDLVRMIEHHASTRPSECALIFLHDFEIGGERTQILSYQDFNARANRMAHHLRSVKSQSDGLVCICLEKSPDLYVAILATIKAGFGYLPLLPGVPPARLRSILAQSQVDLCICDAGTAPLMRESSRADILDVSNTKFDSMSPDNLPSTIAGSDVAYTVFTSGSTGEPKGVAVTVENLLGNLQALSELYQVQNGDKLLQACSQAFDVSVFEIFFAFYSGICLCSATKDVLFTDMEASIRALGITHLSLTPTVAALIEPTNVPTVKFLVTAGEAVTELVHERWAGRGLHQGYGPSETTNICTVNMNVQQDDTLGNIGPPFRNTSAFVIASGPGFRVLPAGAVGEHAFGGEQVFKGYVGMDDLNAEKIIDHPKFGRLYKSGDIGRMLHDGTLLISGRLDDQVKIRGNRVELGEINAALLQSSDIHDCTTLVVGENATDQDLITFVVLHSDVRDSSDFVKVVAPDADFIERLFGRLEDAISSYMIPSMILAVNRLPLTSQGKLDRRSLKGLLAGLADEDKARYSRTLDLVADNEEWSDEERSIANILANGLSIPNVSVSRNASFFGLGLNSLNAISFAKHLTKSLDTPVNPGMVLRNPTVSRLARHLDRRSSNCAKESVAHGQRLLPDGLARDITQQLTSEGEEVEDVLPCTPLQEAMLSASAASESSYCNTTWLEVTGDLDRLKQCWASMMARHTILRTRFVETQSPSHPFVQVVTPKLRLPWTEYQLHSSEEFEGQSSSDPRRVDGTAPFKLEVHKTSDGARLALHMHHAIYDGLSMAQLLHEVESSYWEESLLPTPSFAEFLGSIRSQNSAAAMKFWSRRLDGLLPSPFPSADSKKSATQEHSLHTTMGLQQARLDDYCRRHGVTHLSLFQAALVKMLSNSQGISDICIGNVVSGRSAPIEGIDRLVAPCFNTIPVRAVLARLRSNLDLIKTLAKGNAESVDYQLSPLRRLQGLSADPSKRLFDALLLLQPSGMALDKTIWTLKREVGSMGLPLVLEITPTGEAFSLKLHHSDACISSTLAQSLSQTFVAALRSCLEYPFSDTAHFLGDIDGDVGGALNPKQPERLTNGPSEREEKQSSRGWNAEEAAVRDVFARFANVNADRISQDTSMYQIGLDSLNAPQVASQLRSKGYSVDAADVMEALTPRSIGRSLSSKTRPDMEHSVDLEEFDRKYRQRALQGLRESTGGILKVRPCTSVQSGMLAQSLHSQGGLHINHVTYELPRDITTQRLRSAWTAVLGKHELLRTGFCDLQDPDRPFAMVVRKAEAADVRLVLANSQSSYQRVEQEATALVMEDIKQPPWCITIVSEGDATMTLSMHHAIYDAESLQIILLDLHHMLNRPASADPLNIDPLLASTLASEHEARKSSDVEAFWTSHFENAGYARFPDLNPTVVADDRLDVEMLSSSLGLSQLEQFCRDHSATIQSLGQTTWALLLAAYTGESAVTFGTVFSGRSGSPTWQTIFPSVVTIPVPCNTDRSHWSIMKTMVEYNAAAQRHRSMPLADIQRFAGQPGRSMFDTVFVYQKTAASTEKFDWPLIRETASVEYAVSLELETDSEDTVHFRLTFDTSRIPPQQARLMIRQYEFLLQDLVLGQDAKRSPTHDLRSVVAPKVSGIPSEVRLLHQFVERGAKQHPDAVAFEFVSGIDGESPVLSRWTYVQLDEITNQIAHAIRDAGARPGSVVALSMEKCPEATFAFVGILKAGCAFLALDPDLPQDRVTFILGDSKSSALLTSGKAPAGETPEGIPTLHIDLKALERLPRTRPSLEDVSSSATCYVLYTSGTTGTPKGCEITHENAVQAMLAFQRLFSGHWTKKSRWLQFASYWFDVSVLEQFWSWSVGISVVGAPRDLVLEGIPAFIRAMRITHIDLTPSLARIVHPDDVPSLWGGVFITGGEALKQEIIDAWGSKRTICNGYGPTEATIGVTMNTFVGPDAKPSNIGRAFDNVGAYVLGSDGHTPVLRGGVGELCVSGKLVGKGYLNRPDLTSKQFPFLPELGEKIYRTGDLVRLLHDDSVQFIGRQDSQAKLRGQRLEIGEIDTVIRRSSDRIADVLSLVVKNGHGKEALVSFLTSTGPASSREPKLDLAKEALDIVQQAHSACEQKLPGYMIPTHIIPLIVLPLTVNNKVDAKRLGQLFETLGTKDLQALKQHGGDTRLLNTTERKVCEVLAEMFPIDIDQTQSSSNLFSLGLSSISAISFASILKRAGFARANVATIMKNQSIGQLAAALVGSDENDGMEEEPVQQAKLALKAHAQRHTAAAARTLHLRIEDIETVVPCTPLQQGLIVESLRDESRPYYNRFKYELHDVDLDRLERAFRTLVGKVQVLRSSFVGFDEGYSQVVRKSQRASVERWTGPSKALDAAMLDKKQHWYWSNLQDLVAPFEVHILHSNEVDILMVHIHHALYDAISYELIMHHVWQIFSAGELMDDGPSFTDALPHGPFKQIPGSENFWKQRLLGSGHVPLSKRYPEAGPDPLVQLSFGHSANLEQSRQQLGVSHQAMAQAALEVALRKSPITNEARTYGIVVSGRSVDLQGAEKVLGPMFNTLPQPITANPAVSLSAFVRRCHEMNAQALPYQHTPLRDIRKWTAMQPGSPLFDVLFVFQHTADTAEQDNHFCSLVDSQAHAEYPLACEVELHGDGRLDITLLAKSQYFSNSGLLTLASDLEYALETAIRFPDSNLGDVFGIEQINTAAENQGSSQEMPQLNCVESFAWSKEATVIRDALAQLAGIGSEDVDEHTSLFSVGLDSIDAVRLASRLRSAGVPLPVSEILRAQTIPRMLDRLPDHNGTINSVEPSQLEKLERRLKASLEGLLGSSPGVERILPATPNQEALIADMLRSEFREYLNHDILRLSSEVNVKRLKDAWQSVIDLNPLLRTSFIQVAEPELSTVFAQVVHPKAPISMAELRYESMHQIDGYIERVRNDVAATLEHTAPLRLAIVSVDRTRYLIFSAAHALYDGHSLALLHEDVHRAYDGSSQSRPPYDEAVEAALTAVEADSLEFWGNVLSGSRPQAFTRTTRTIEGNNTYRAEAESRVSAGTVRSFCQSQGISMQALAQTSWALTLAQYAQSMEVLFGVVLACRDSAEAEEVLFPMMNTIVTRSSLHGSRLDMLRYMQSGITEMLAHQRTPLRAIQKACSGVLDDGAAELNGALFDTLFLYQHRPDTQETNGDPLYESVGGSSSIEYPVAVEMEVVGDTLAIRAACKRTVLDQDGTNKLVNTVDRVLQSIVSSPSEPTVDLRGRKASICGLPSFEIRSNEALSNGTGGTHDQLDVADEDSAVVRAILQVFAQVSDVPVANLGPSSTIESIGIDSISAIKVVSLLRKKDIKLSVSDIVRAKSAARMAAHVSKQSDPPSNGTTHSRKVLDEVMQTVNICDVARSAGIDPEDVESILPATAGQIYMLSMWKKTGGQIFFPTFTYRLPPSASETDLRTAWTTLEECHQILRTVFASSKDKDHPVVQLVLRRGFASQSTKQHPMVRWNIRRADAGPELDLMIHHALYDAVSLPLLVQDLERLLATKPVSTSHVQQEDLFALSVTKEARSRQKDFWTNYLRNITPIKLPQPALDGQQSKVEIFQPTLFSRTAALEALARKEELSIQALLFSAYAKVYSKFPAKTGSVATDVVLGSYLANRAHLPDLDSVAMPTLNLVPLLVRSPSRKTLLEVAKNIQRDLEEIGAPENSSTALWQIAGWTGVKVDTFVNLLKLPGRNEDGEQGERSVKIEEVSDKRLKARREVVEVERSGAATFMPLPPVAESGVMDAYQHSVDIEMTVVDGRLDVGLFAPLEMLSLEEADAALAELRDLLDGLAGQTNGKA